MVRSNLEYATTVWNPHYEKVPLRATVITIKHLPFAERWKALQLPIVNTAESGVTWLNTKFLQAVTILT